MQKLTDIKIVIITGFHVLQKLSAGRKRYKKNHTKFLQTIMCEI